MEPKHPLSLTVALRTTCFVLLVTVSILAPTHGNSDKAPPKSFKCSDYPFAPRCIGAGAFKRLSPPVTHSHRFEPDMVDLKTLMQFNGPPEYGEYGPNEVKLPEQFLREILRKYWNHEPWSEE